MIVKGKICLFLHKNLCCGYSLESILMSAHNICFYGELVKFILQLSSDILLIFSTE